MSQTCTQAFAMISNTSWEKHSFHILWLLQELMLTHEAHSSIALIALNPSSLASVFSYRWSVSLKKGMQWYLALENENCENWETPETLRTIYLCLRPDSFFNHLKYFFNYIINPCIISNKYKLFIRYFLWKEVCRNR